MCTCSPPWPLRRTAYTNHRPLGFSLVELLIAVAIVGILGAVALPSYRSYLIRGNLPDATATLALKAVRLEQYFQDYRSYVGAPACESDGTSSKHFRFECNTSASTFTLTATGLGSMEGFVFSMDESNRKQTLSVPPGWQASSTCWVSNANGAC